MTFLHGLFAPLWCALVGHVKPTLERSYWGDLHRCGVRYRGFAYCRRCNGHGPFGHTLTSDEVGQIEGIQP